MGKNIICDWPRPCKHTQCKMGPSPSHFFHHNSNLMAISGCSNPDSNEPIDTNFGTWHNSWAVMACGKNWGDIPANKFFTEFKLWWKNHLCNEPRLRQWHWLDIPEFFAVNSQLCVASHVEEIQLRCHQTRHAHIQQSVVTHIQHLKIQGNTWTNADLLSIGPSETIKLQGILNKTRNCRSVIY